MSDQKTPKRAMTRALNLAIEIPAVTVAFVMMVVVTANALSRALFNSPIPYTTEMTQYWFMPILALLGFMAAQSRGQHIAADLLYARLPELARQWITVVLFTVAAILLAAIAYYGWGEAVEAFEIRMRAGIAPLPAWPVYFLVPVAFGVMAIQFITTAVGIARHGAPDDEDEFAPTDAEVDTNVVGRVKES